MEKPLFILHGNGSFLNHGCEAILRSTVSILQKEFGPCRFVNSPPRWVELGQVDDLDADIIHKMPHKIVRWRPRWFVYRLRRRLLGGGREIFEPYLPESAATLSLGGDNYSLDYGKPVRFFEANKATLRYGKPVVLWGASIGPFSKDPEFEKYAAHELKKATLICARESETIAYLAKLGVCHNVRAVSDPAFVLEPQVIEDIPPRLKIIQKPCIGINISPLLGRYWQGEQCWIEHVRKCVRAILEKVDLPVILIPHVVQPTNDDYAFMKQVVENLGDFRSQITLIDRHYNAPQLKWIISQMKVFVGTRTHSTIASLSSCVPTVSIAYSMKARGLNKDIFGHYDWVIPVNELRAEFLAEKVNTLLNLSSKVRAHLMGMMPAYQQRAWDAAKHIRELLP